MVSPHWHPASLIGNVAAWAGDRLADVDPATGVWCDEVAHGGSGRLRLEEWGPTHDVAYGWAVKAPGVYAGLRQLAMEVASGPGVFPVCVRGCMCVCMCV